MPLKREIVTINFTKKEYMDESRDRPSGVDYLGTLVTCDNDVSREVESCE